MSLIDRTWKNLRRSPYQSLAAIIIMIVTFLITSAFILSAVISQRAITYLEKQPKLLIFFQQDITSEDQIKDMEDGLKATGYTTDIKFVTKEEANAIYQELNKDDPLLLELVTPDILPASVEVSLSDSRYLSEVVKTVKDDQRIFDIASPEEVVKNLISITGTIRIFGTILILVLILESILVIIMITAMRIAIRREEIQIMSLVGASSWYIRKPYLAEGAIYGFIGAAISVIVIYALLFSFTPALARYFAGAQIFPIPIWQLATIAIFQMILGVGIGTLGSFLAVLRYLR